MKPMFSWLLHPVWPLHPIPTRLGRTGARPHRGLSGDTPTLSRIKTAPVKTGLNILNTTSKFFKEAVLTHDATVAPKTNRNCSLLVEITKAKESEPGLSIFQTKRWVCTGRRIASCCFSRFAVQGKKKNSYTQDTRPLVLPRPKH